MTAPVTLTQRDDFKTYLAYRNKFILDNYIRHRWSDGVIFSHEDYAAVEEKWLSDDAITENYYMYYVDDDGAAWWFHI